MKKLTIFLLAALVMLAGCSTPSGSDTPGDATATPSASAAAIHVYTRDATSGTRGAADLIGH